MQEGPTPSRKELALRPKNASRPFMTELQSRFAMVASSLNSTEHSNQDRNIDQNSSIGWMAE